MHKEEIFSLIKLIDKTNIDQLKEISFTSDYLPIIFFIMLSYYENKSCTVSNLSFSNKIPFNTAKRKINNLINAKLIYRNTRLRNGKHNIFLPTPSLINIFEDYLNNIKNHIGNNFGINENNTDSNNWYYGGKYFKSKTIPNPQKTILKNKHLKDIKFLVWESSAFNFLKNYVEPLENLTNLKITFQKMKWDDLKREIITNGKNKFSKYDLVLYDSIWLADLIHNKSILDISEYILSEEFELSDFYHEGMYANRFKNNYYGIPFQVTMHNLCYRKDIFLKKALSGPENTFDIIKSLKILHKPEKNIYGISFTGAKGMHLGNFFCSLLGATFETPLFNFNKVYKGYEIDNIKMSNLETNINNANSIKALEFIKEIYQYGHPNILNLTQGLQHKPFFKKEVCMAFIWSGMMGPVELDNMHPLYKKTETLPFPTFYKNQNHILPYGGFNIGIPNNIRENKIKSIWNFLNFFTSSESFKKIHSLGGICTPRFSLIKDPEITDHSSLTKDISNYSQNHMLQNWMRPALKNMELIYVILTNEIREYLQNNISSKYIAQNLENKINKIIKNEANI